MLFIIATIHTTILYQLGTITQVNNVFYPMFSIYFVALVTWTTLFLRKYRKRT